MGLSGYFLELAFSIIERIGYAGVFFILVVDNAGVPIPSEATLALAGSLAKTGNFNIWAVVAIGAIAQTLGTSLAYAIGYYGGGPVVKRYGKYLLISAHDYDKAEAWFAKRGERAIFISRFVPVIRTFAGFAAGTFEMNFWKFARDSFAGSLIWTLVFVLAGYSLGDSWKNYYQYFHYLDYIVLVVVVILVVRYIYRKTKGRKAEVKHDQ